MRYVLLLSALLVGCSSVRPVAQLYNPNGPSVATGFNIKTKVGVRGITAGHFCGKEQTLFVLQSDAKRLPVQFDDYGVDLCVTTPIEGVKTYTVSAKPVEPGEQLRFLGFPFPAQELTIRNGKFIGYLVDMMPYPANSKGVCPTAVVQGQDQRGNSVCLGIVAFGVMEGEVYQGNSGGPVIRVSDGTVVGIMAQTEVPTYTRAFFTPIEALTALIEAGDVK